MPSDPPSFCACAAAVYASAGAPPRLSLVYELRPRADFVVAAARTDQEQAQAQEPSRVRFTRRVFDGCVHLCHVGADRGSRSVGGGGDADGRGDPRGDAASTAIVSLDERGDEGSSDSNLSYALFAKVRRIEPQPALGASSSDEASSGEDDEDEESAVGVVTAILEGDALARIARLASQSVRTPRGLSEAACRSWYDAIASACARELR